MSISFTPVRGRAQFRSKEGVIYLVDEEHQRFMRPGVGGRFGFPQLIPFTTPKGEELLREYRQAQSSGQTRTEEEISTIKKLIDNMNKAITVIDENLQLQKNESKFLDAMTNLIQYLVRFDASGPDRAQRLADGLKAQQRNEAEEVAVINELRAYLTEMKERAEKLVSS